MQNKKDFIILLSIGGLLLCIVIGFSIKYLFLNTKKSASVVSIENRKEKGYPLFSPDALRLKISRSEPIEIIDLRPKSLFDEEHLLDAKQFDIDTLPGYEPQEHDAQVIVVSLADDEELRIAAHKILEKKSFPYAFLEGGIPAWKAIGGSTVSFGDIDSFIDRSKVLPITSDELKKLLEDIDFQNRYVIVDVRQKNDYRTGHIVRAINIPLAELEARRHEIPAGRQVITYGATDLEGFRAAVRLFDFNFFSSQALSGGINEWKTKKFPIES